MEIQIETVGSTNQPCIVCGGKPYKYVSGAGAGINIVCNNANCIITAIQYAVDANMESFFED